jgi:hypothetical protein
MHLMFQAWLLAAWLATGLVAQAHPERRQPLPGQVVDAAGGAVAGATVTLVEDDCDLVGLDPVDVLTVTTDSRGRFVARAQVGVRYSAFAVGAEVDGRAMVAKPVHDLWCGRTAELRLDVKGQRRRYAVPELTAWRAGGEVRLRLMFAGCAGHTIDLPIDGDGHIELPPVAVVGDAELVDAAGGFLSTVAVLPDEPEPLWLPPPVSVLVHVVDANGKGIAGAQVAMRHERGRDDRYFAIGTEECRDAITATTGADGRARVRFGRYADPFDQVPESLIVVANKNGFAESASGWICKFPFVDRRVVEAHEKRTVRVTLLPAAERRQQVVGDGLAGRPARVLSMGIATKQKDTATTRYFVPWRDDVVIGADGSFVLPEAPAATLSRRLLLPPVDGRRVVTMPVRGAELPPFSLADCELLSLRLVDASGGPAVTAMVLLVPAASHSHDFMHTIPLVPDQAGRVEVLLQRGRWALLAMDATSWASLDLHEWAATTPVRLELAPKPSLRVRVVDRAGQPVARASFEPGGFDWGRSQPAGVAAALAELGWNMFAQHVRAASTDERGEARLTFLPWPGAQPTAFAWRGSHKTRSDDVPIAEADDVLVVRMR